MARSGGRAEKGTTLEPGAASNHSSLTNLRARDGSCTSIDAVPTHGPGSAAAAPDTHAASAKASDDKPIFMRSLLLDRWRWWPHVPHLIRGPALHSLQTKGL